MTISANNNPQQYTGDGTNASLNTVFVFFTSSDIVVKQRVIATGTEITLIEGTHYSVTGGSAAGAVGTVEVTDGATDFTSAVTWTIERVIPNTQTLDYVENDSFPAASHESGMDRLTMQAQDRKSVSDRTMRFPVTDAPSLTSEIPSSVLRAGKALTFDSSGNATVSTQTSTGYGRVLLDSAYVSTGLGPSITLTETNWPATYDFIELEFFDVYPLTGASPILKFLPVDDGTPATTIHKVGWTFENSTGLANSAANWNLTRMDSAVTASAVSGKLTLRSMAFGTRLSGHLEATWRYTGPIFSKAELGLYTTAAGTSWDGINLAFDGAENFGGGSTFRLWGIPRV